MEVAYNNWKEKQKKEQTLGKEEAYFQSYDIIRCKCLVLNKKITRNKKKQESKPHSKEKSKLSQRNTR